MNKFTFQPQTIFVDESLVRTPETALKMATAIRVLESRRKLLDHDIFVTGDGSPAVTPLDKSMVGIQLRCDLLFALAHQSTVESSLMLRETKRRLDK
ncbi:hypothetical protein HYV64_01160 [Candidatus Shapirobacteria bacterium]|nr:hypothetical protein [Candidatus Shapirobacteria bacterium]